jgi:hypothetical protein
MYPYDRWNQPKASTLRNKTWRVEPGGLQQEEAPVARALPARLSVCLWLSLSRPQGCACVCVCLAFSCSRCLSLARSLYLSPPPPPLSSPLPVSLSVSFSLSLSISAPCSLPPRRCLSLSLYMRCALWVLLLTQPVDQEMRHFEYVVKCESTSSRFTHLRHFNHLSFHSIAAPYIQYTQQNFAVYVLVCLLIYCTLPHYVYEWMHVVVDFV